MLEQLGAWSELSAQSAVTAAVWLGMAVQDRWHETQKRALLSHLGLAGPMVLFTIGSHSGLGFVETYAIEALATRDPMEPRLWAILDDVFARKVVLVPNAIATLRALGLAQHAVPTRFVQQVRSAVTAEGGPMGALGVTLCSSFVPP